MGSFGRNGPLKCLAMALPSYDWHEPYNGKESRMPYDDIFKRILSASFFVICLFSFAEFASAEVVVKIVSQIEATTAAK